MLVHWMFFPQQVMLQLRHPLGMEVDHTAQIVNTSSDAYPGP